MIPSVIVVIDHDPDPKAQAELRREYPELVIAAGSKQDPRLLRRRSPVWQGMDQATTDSTARGGIRNTQAAVEGHVIDPSGLRRTPQDRSPVDLARIPILSEFVIE